MRLSINDSQILWPGKVRKKPEGIMIPTHLKVLTVEEKPFVYVRKLADDVPARCDDDEIPCPLFNATDGVGKYGRVASLLFCLLGEWVLACDRVCIISFRRLAHRVINIYSVNDDEWGVEDGGSNKGVHSLWWRNCV